jgi:non-ribosomal peptide synthetase component F
MDGWCLGIIFKDFMGLFWSLKKEKPMELEPLTPYINYIKWINRQDRQEGLRYWKDYLEGYNQKVSLPRLGGLMENGGYQLENHLLDIDEVVTERLNWIASTNQVTMSTVFQSIWGILLQKYNNCDDVVFGAVVSGRPPEIEDIEHMVGLFINTLPVRIRAGEAQDISSLLQWVQQKSVSSKSFEYLPLAEIQVNSPFKRDLVDHIMAFENFPTAKKIRETGNEDEFIFKVEEFTIRGRSSYDLHITVIPGKRIHVKFGFNRNVYGPGFIKKVASHFQEIIRQIVEDHGIQLDEIKISHDFLETKSNILEDDREDWI